MLGSFVVATGITGTAIFFLSRIAAETERTRQRAQAESDCANQVPAMVNLVQAKDSMQGARIQVTATESHFNRRLQQCLVEVKTFEHGATPIYVKSLVNAAQRSMVFWTLAGDDRASVRNCFNAEARQVDCGEVDNQWKTLMFE